METQHKGYSLPHKDHDVVEDVKKISKNFIKIDENISNIELNVDALTKRFLEIVPFIANVETKVIQNIKAGYYLKTSQDEISCEEGGEDAGGSRFYLLEKQSTEDFDTAWERSSSINKENLRTSQALSSVESFENESYIFKDEIENKNDDKDKATKENYGIIKPGASIDIQNGVLSIFRDKKATKKEAGIVKIGDGIEFENDVLTLQKRPYATHETFGMVKLNHEFGLKDEALHVIKTGEKIIYQLGDTKVVDHGHLNLNLECVHYRAFVNEDLIFSISLDFVQEKDLSFILEIISDGIHIVSFGSDVSESYQHINVNKGKTIIKFSKILGASKWDLEISRLDAPAPVLLTPTNKESVSSNLIVSVNGSSWTPADMLIEQTRDIPFVNNPREIYFDFTKSMSVDYVYFNDNASAVVSLFEFYGSYDKIHWVRLIYKTDSQIEKKTSTERKGAFRYFKLRFTNECSLRCVQLYGTALDDNDSELFLLTPKLSSNLQAGITITCSELNSGSLKDITSPSTDSYAQVAVGNHEFAFFQYEFDKPQVVNFVDIASYKGNVDVSPRWFTIEALNDDGTWEVLIARQYLENWFESETRCFSLDNEKPFKIYRLVCQYSEHGTLFRVARFRLYRRERGTSSLLDSQPKFLATTQDGYEISASSENGVGRSVIFAFDKDNDTYWLSETGKQSGSWLKIKLPTPAVFTGVHLRPPFDNYTRAPSIFKIQGSNDDVNWTDLAYELTEWTSSESKFFYFQNETAYQFYRILIESVQNNGTLAGLARFEVGRQDKSYKKHLKRYDYLVPILNSASQDGFVVTCSSQYNTTSEAAYRLFDRSENQWTTKEWNPSNQWVRIELPIPAICSHFSLKSSDATSRIPKNFAIQGSNDGDTWIDIIYKENFSWNSYTTKTFENPDKTIAYKYYRLYVYANNGSGNYTSLRRFDLLNFVTELEY